MRVVAQPKWILVWLLLYSALYPLQNPLTLEPAHPGTGHQVHLFRGSANVTCSHILSSVIKVVPG